MNPGVLSRCVGSHDMHPALLALPNDQALQSGALRHIEPVGLSVLVARMTVLLHEALHHCQPLPRPVLGPPAGLHSAEPCPATRWTFARLFLAPAPLNPIELAGALTNGKSWANARSAGGHLLACSETISGQLTVPWLAQQSSTSCAKTDSIR